MLSGAGSAIRRPVDFINNKTFADLGQSGIGKTVGRATQATFNGLGAAAGRFSNWTGLGARASNGQMGKVFGQLEKARGLGGKVDLNGFHPTLRPHVETLHGLVNAGPNAGHVDVAALTKAHAGYREALGSLTLAEGEQAIAKTGLKQAQKFEGAVARAIGHHQSAAGWQDVAGTVKGLPGEMKGARLGTGLMHGAWIIGSGFSLINGARNFFKDIRTLREMQAAATGKDTRDVSSLGVLMGGVSAPVVQARKNLFRNFLAREAVETGMLAANIKWARGGHLSGTAIGAQMFAPMLVEGMMGHDSVLPVYKAFNEAYQSGQEVPEELYAAFLSASAPELKNKPPQFAGTLAQEYAREKASPTQVMKEIEDGKLLVRIEKLITAHEAQVAPAAAGVSHAARVNGDKAARPVVGPHTQQLNEQALTPQGLTPAGG
jgi:hypothetical protein